MKNKTVTIIPLISTDGAGKTSVAEKLATNYGFAHYSIRNVLFTIYEQKFLKTPSKPSDITELANQLRFEFGPHILMKKVIDTIQSSNTKGFCVIESIRCPGELEYFYSLENEILVKPVGIDAPAETRYKRLQTRGDYKAPENFDEFEKNELAEWNQSDPWKQNIKKCLSMIPQNGLFQNLDGQLSQTLISVHGYILS